MAAEPTRSLAIHATAVAVGDRALLIRGASRAGKSRLALALIARTTLALPIRLIGDDRIELHRVAGALVARPHPRIAGFIERRGLGLVAMPWVAEARVGGIVDLRHYGVSLHEPRNDELLDTEVHRLVLDRGCETERADRVLAWWAGLTATWAPHSLAKAVDARLACAKD